MKNDWYNELVAGLPARARCLGLVLEIEEVRLGIGELGSETEVFGPGDIDYDYVDNHYLANVFMAGAEHMSRKAEDREKAAYERGVADAWADVRRRLQR